MPPVIPAVIAFAGSIWGLFNLTLGQDPANALPNWSPAIGWGAALGSLALASVLAWIGLVRRKCPDCGSTQMLDAMEEEGLIASERLAAQKAAVDEVRAELEKKAQGPSGRDPRAEIETELRAAHAKEMAERLAAREVEVRGEVERRLRAEHERQSAENERGLRKKLEEELRSKIEGELRSEIGAQPRPSPPAPTHLAKTPAPVNPIPSVVFPAAARPITPPPTTTAKAIAVSVASPAAARPVTPPPTTTAKAIAASTAVEGVAAKAGTAATPGAGAIEKTALPAVPQAKTETAPLALMAAAGRAAIRSPAPATPTPASSPQTLPPATDGHERAKRRARVILSDLLAYHRDELLKAAHAVDPRKELGPLWRDAVVSYNEVATPEIRTATNYLEDELAKQLSELRRA